MTATAKVRAMKVELQDDLELEIDPVKRQEIARMIQGIFKMMEKENVK
jgi:hypothetical protein